jgi:hypothetical protein
VEDVAGEALGVNSHEDVLAPAHVALDHRQVVLVVHQRAVADRGELAEGGGQPRRDHALDQPLGPPPIGDQVGDRDHAQPVALAVGHQVGHPGHGPVLVHDLADHSGRDQAGQAGQIDGGLRLTGALQHASLLRLQREHVAGLDEVRRLRVRVDGDLDRVRAIVGGDPRRHAVRRLDRDGERRVERGLVLRGHQVELQLVAALRRERQADQAAAMHRHEVDRLGRRELRGEGEVALVLAVLVVADDHHAPAPHVLDRLFDRRKLRGRICRGAPFSHLPSFPRP